MRSERKKINRGDQLQTYHIKNFLSTKERALGGRNTTLLQQGWRRVNLLSE